MKCKKCNKTTDGKYSKYCMFCGHSFQEKDVLHKVTLSIEAKLTAEEIQRLLNRE